MVEKNDSYLVLQSTLQSSMVISRSTPCRIPSGETFSFKGLTSLKLKIFLLLLYIFVSYQYQFIPMHHNNYHIKAVQVHESNFIPTWPSKSTQEIAIHTATLMAIGVYIRQSPCGIIIVTFHTSVLLSVLQGSWVCLGMFSGCTGFATVWLRGCHSLGYLHYYQWKLFLWRAFCPEDGMWYELAITMISNWVIWFLAP